jgi:hypothetical protein
VRSYFFNSRLFQQGISLLAGRQEVCSFYDLARVLLKPLFERCRLLYSAPRDPHRDLSNVAKV